MAHSNDTRPHIYFLGIGGTLIGNLAILAQEAGFRVSGSDGKIYPPMSDLLHQAKIEVFEGFDPEQLRNEPQCVIIGNANLPRGNAALEYVLNHDLYYASGPEWLANHILQDRHVFAVSGTHGKTTTTGMLSWILEFSQKQPGFLIGGIPHNFENPARIGGEQYFVIEADEYDTSYFDRRAKFMHYRPRTLIINNLEHDHADIYANLEAIQYQFEHLIRTVPGNGRIIVPWGVPNISDVLDRGVWSPISHTLVNPTDSQLNQATAESNDLWVATTQAQGGTKFTVSQNGKHLGTVHWQQFGLHNVTNALSAIVASQEAQVPVGSALKALESFKGIKRRMEIFARAEKLTFYDDFAHHPTAIDATLQGLRHQVGDERIIAVVEPRTHTMQLGAHRQSLVTCCDSADEVIWFHGPNVQLDLEAVAKESTKPSSIEHDIDQLVATLCQTKQSPTHIVLMSNGGFSGIYELISDQLKQR